MAVSVDSLQRLCLPEHPQCSMPFLRRRGKAIWTVATNGHALVAVRGRFAPLSREGLPGLALRGIFRMTHRNVRKPGWSTPIEASFSALQAFLRAAPVHQKSEDKAKPVSVATVILNARLLGKYLRELEAETIALRRSNDTFTAFEGDTRHCAIRVDAPDWSVVCMGIAGLEPLAVFSEVR